MNEKIYEEQRTYMHQRLPSPPFVKMIRDLYQYMSRTTIGTVTGIPDRTLRAMIYDKSRGQIIRKHAVMIYTLHKQFFKALKVVQKTRESVQKF